MVDKKIAIKTNTNLSDASITEIDRLIDDLISKHSENSEKMNLIALEATSLATSVKARSKGLEEQGFLRRVLGNLTGKNQKVSARNAADLAEAQYIGQQTLNKLAENNLMTYQMTVALGDKVNRVIDDANAAKRDFLELNQRLAHFFESMRNNLEARFGALEKTVALLHWKEIIEFQPVYKGKPYPELTRPEKIICLANDFFTLTAQEWKPKDLPFLKSVIVAIGNHPTEKVALKEIYSAYQEDPLILSQLLKGLNDNEPLLNVELAPTLLAFNKLNEFTSSDKHIVDTILDYAPNQTADSVSLELTNKLLINDVSRDLNKEHEFYDVVMNLVEDLVIYKSVKEANISGNQTDSASPAITNTNHVEKLDVSIESFLNECSFKVKSKLIKFPKRSQSNRGELSINFTNSNNPFILLGLNIGTSGFVKNGKQTICMTDYKEQLLPKEAQELRLLNSKLKVTGKTRAFDVLLKPLNDNKFIELEQTKAEEIAQITEQNIKVLDELIVKTKYLASNAVGVELLYLEFSKNSEHLSVNKSHKCRIDSSLIIENIEQLQGAVQSNPFKTIYLNGEEFTIDDQLESAVQIKLEGTGKTKLVLTYSFGAESQLLKCSNLFLTAKEPIDICFLNKEHFEEFKGENLTIDYKMINIILIDEMINSFEDIT